MKMMLMLSKQKIEFKNCVSDGSRLYSLLLVCLLLCSSVFTVLPVAVSEEGDYWYIAYDANWPGGSAGTGNSPHVDEFWNDGSWYWPSVSVQYPTLFSKTGYKLLGWSRSSAASVPEFTGGEYGYWNELFPEQSGLDSVELYGVWESVGFTVTYNGNGATGGSVPVDSDLYYQGGSVPVAVNTGNLVRSGYSFLGWATSSGATSPTYTVSGSSVSPSTFTMPSNNVVLYAVWGTVPQFTVSYSGNGHTSGSAPTDSNSPYYSGSSVTVLGNTGNLQRTGYTFLGWSTNSATTSVQYTAGQTFAITQNTILYAVWQSTSQIIYNNNNTAVVNTSFSIGNQSSSVLFSSASLGFVANESATLKSVDFKICRMYTGTFSDVLVAKLYLGTGSGASIVPTGNALAVSNPIKQSDIPYNASGVGEWISFQFVNNYNMTKGVTYCIVLEYATYDNNHSDNRVRFEVFSVSSTLSRPHRFQEVGGGSWVQSSAAVQFKFILYGEPLPAYSVSYNGNGATGGSVPVDSSSPYTAGSTVTVRANTGNLVRPNYTFLGWSNSSSATVPQFSVSGSSVSPSSFVMPAAPVVLYAVWQQNPRYSVTYNGNGNTGGSVPVNSNLYYQGASVPVAANTGNLVRTNYRFLGWATSSGATSPTYTVSGSSVSPSSFTMGSANVVLYAVWVRTYTVTYNANGATGGSVPTDGNSPYAAGASVVVLANTGNLVRSGYTFLGWATSSGASSPTYTVSGSSVSPSSFVMGSANVVLYAVWSAIPTFAVTYNGNGNTGGSVPVDSSSPYTAGASVTVLANTGNLVRSGYSFLGWAASSGASVPDFVVSGSSVSPSSFVMPAEPVVLYAVWQQNPRYSVTYNANGATGGSVPVDGNSPYYAGTSVTVLANTGSLVRSGYTFLGWATSSGASSPTYTVSGSSVSPSSFVMGSANVVLYAVWQQNLYTVTFSPGTHGTFSAQVTSNLKYGDATPGAPATPGESGWVFTGWLPGVASTVTGTVTYVAQWQADDPGATSFTVQFVDWDGTLLKSQTVVAGGSAVAPADPSREGYVFTGWDKSFSNVQSNLVVTATYSPVVGPTPTPPPVTPTVPPAGSRPVETVMLFFRGDDATTGGVSGFGLGDSSSKEAGSFGGVGSGGISVGLGFRVWLVLGGEGGGELVELTSGVPVGVVTFVPSGGNFSGYVSGVWSFEGCPVVLGEDALFVVFYSAVDDGANLVARAEFVSPVLLTSGLLESQWVFRYWVDYTGNSFTVSWGGKYSGAGIGNVVMFVASGFDVMFFKLVNLDVAGFVLYPYLAVFGSLFYVLALIAMLGAYYIWHGKVSVVVYAIVLFGSAGGLLFVLLPLPAMLLLWVFVAVGIGVLLFRVFR